MSKASRKKGSRRRGKKPGKARRAPSASMAPRSALGIATSTRKPVAERVAAMAYVTPIVCGDDAQLEALLKVLRDPNEPIRVRLAALQALQAASFAVVEFQSCRGPYLATLRAVATDPDPEIRQRVLGLLARENDGFAEQKLLAGLQNPEDALVPPEKALQLLSYDVHAEAYPVARMIVSQPPNEAAREEALRLLAADASAQPLFEQILRDKKETKEVRQLCASALQAIAPKALQRHARAILLDPKEYDDIQTTSLTALTQFGNLASIENDNKLLERVTALKGTASSKLKQGARRFLTKYGP